MYSDENVQRYIKGLYPVALLLILVPLVDLSLRVFPPQFGTLQWRFASTGLLMGNLGTILLGVGLFGLVAVFADHKRLLRGVGFAALALAVVLLALLVLFALDAIQIRRLANANFKRAVLLSSMGALFNCLFSAGALLFIGRAALAGSRATRVPARRPKPASVGAKGASPLLVARPQPTAEIAPSAEMAAPSRASESV